MKIASPKSSINHSQLVHLEAVLVWPTCPPLITHFRKWDGPGKHVSCSFTWLEVCLAKRPTHYLLNLTMTVGTRSAKVAVSLHGACSGWKGIRIGFKSSLNSIQKVFIQQIAHNAAHRATVSIETLLRPKPLWLLPRSTPAALVAARAHLE